MKGEAATALNAGVEAASSGDLAAGSRIRARPARQPIRRSGFVRPPLEHLNVTGYAISDYDDFDRAGQWDHCEPSCSEAAYLINLYPDLEAARAAIPARARALFTRLHPRDPAAMTREVPQPFRIFRLSVAELYGRDYRDVGCQLAGWHDQLHDGKGDELAWHELRRQRTNDAIEGVLLPGTTTKGDLFLFARAAPQRIVERELMEIEEWSWDQAR